MLGYQEGRGIDTDWLGSLNAKKLREMIDKFDAVTGNLGTTVLDENKETPTELYLVDDTRETVFENKDMQTEILFENKDMQTEINFENKDMQTEITSENKDMQTEIGLDSTKINSYYEEKHSGLEAIFDIPENHSKSVGKSIGVFEENSIPDLLEANTNASESSESLSVGSLSLDELLSLGSP